ncbi:hypothetical protein L195_g057360, partial [Trifolium pratense]
AEEVSKVDWFVMRFRDDGEIRSVHDSGFEVMCGMEEGRCLCDSRSGGVVGGGGKRKRRLVEDGTTTTRRRR